MHTPEDLRRDRAKRAAGYSLITHRTQTLPNNCVSTCLAMILDEPVAAITEAFHEQYLHKQMLPSQYLATLYVKCTRHFAEEVAGLTEDAVHVVTVPSLNIPHGLHQILVVEETDGMIHVLDPNTGREGRKAYDRWPLPSWWRIDLTIPRAEVVKHHIRRSRTIEGSALWQQMADAPMVGFGTEEEISALYLQPHTPE